MPKKSRSFSAETKLAVVKRMLCGEEVRALAKGIYGDTLPIASIP